MSAFFSIEVDVARDLVRIQMAGFFSREDVTTFIRARAAEHAKLRCGPNRHLTLNDIREMKIQPREAVDAFQEMMADPACHSRRLAFVTAPTLARAQLVRALAGRQARLFQDPAEAEAWLLADGVRFGRAA